MNQPITFTREGLAQLASIVRTARGDTSLPEFGLKVGIHYTTIWKIEKEKHSQIRLETLRALAPHVGYSSEELLSIAGGKPPLESHQKASMSVFEILTSISQLSKEQRRQLRRLVIAAEVDIAEVLDSMNVVNDELNKRLGSDRDP